MESIGIASNTIIQPRKKPSLPRRPRLRDWPIKVYSYHCEIVGELPDWVNSVEELMRRCWNDMAGELKRAGTAAREHRYFTG